MGALKLQEWQAQYQRQHGTKLRYKKQTAADAVAAVMEEKSGIPQHSYRCKFCGGWHYGRDARRSKVETTARRSLRGWAPQPDDDSPRRRVWTMP